MLALAVIFLFALRRFTARSCWLAVPHNDTRLGTLGDTIDHEDNRAQLNMLAREIREDWRR